MNKEKTILSREKYNEIKKEMDHLIQVERPSVIKTIQDAREQGDLSENADYDAAKQKQAEIETKIKQLENILNHCEIIEGARSNKKPEVVKIGTVVEIYDLAEKKSFEYAIVGTVEADPDKNKISNESPLAIAILGKKKGDEVEIKGIERPYRVKILSISKL
ncbi:transcription elongation factor GreA [bacterium]|nr:transcription elongation factor GreA [bacterium]